MILTVTKLGLSETLLWHARAGQARRVAGMLSPRDAALLEAYARECEDCARAASIDSARANPDVAGVIPGLALSARYEFSTKGSQLVAGRCNTRFLRNGTAIGVTRISQESVVAGARNA